MRPCNEVDWVDPGSVAAIIAEHPGPVVLDLDETLYLRNSTQDFLASAHPRMLSVAILRLLARLSPWRWTGPRTDDVWRTAAICLLMPWVWLSWRRRAPVLGRRHHNEVLVRAANARDDAVHVASFGFGPIVRPLLAGIPVSVDRVVTCRLFSFQDRARGKKHLLQTALGRSAVERAAIITDSEDDRDVLSACAAPMKIVWAGSKYVSATKLFCFPFEYSLKVKRQNCGYMKTILREDFFSWLIASFYIIKSHPIFIFGMSALFVAFWAIYEIGYIENDRAAATKEADGVISAAHDPELIMGLQRRLVASALSLSILGLWIIHADVTSCITWFSVLFSLRAVYSLYNRVDKSSRVFLYLVLQLYRSSAILFLVQGSVVSVSICLSLAVSQWISYIVYRSKTPGSDYNWPQSPLRLYRVILFLCFAIGFGTTADWNLTTLSLMALSAAALTFFARAEIRAVLSQARLL